MAIVIDPNNVAQIEAQNKERNSDIARIDPWLKAFALSINDGSIVPGGNLKPSQLKAAVKAKM